MSIAKQMWDYLKSIGFEDIPNNDERLGHQFYYPWNYVIVRDNLCAYCDKMDEFVGLVDKTKGNYGTDILGLNIHSVQDLKNWLRKEYPEFYKKETNMITKDNIEAVLKNNGIDDFNLWSKLIAIGENESYIEVYLDNPNLIPIIEAHLGKKLDPFPDEETVLKVGDVVEDSKYGKLNIIRFDYVEYFVVCGFCGSIIRLGFEYFNTKKSVNGKQSKFVIPPFDFEQALLDAGFKRNYLEYIGSHIDFHQSYIWYDHKIKTVNSNSNKIKPTPANAKRLIDAAAILNELESAE